MRPVRPTAVHKTDRLAELVCSNSFRGDKLDNAVGLLKEEMRRLGSLVMRARPTPASRPAPRSPSTGTASREAVTDAITVAPADHRRPRGSTAPARAGRRADDHRHRSADVRRALARHRSASSVAEHLSFYDAISPIVLGRDASIARRCFAPRGGTGAWVRRRRRRRTRPRTAAGPACGVDDGQGDYLNCPMTRDEYEAFYDALVHAESATVHDFDTATFFEGCLPIEVMAHRGPRHAALRSDEAGRPRRSADRTPGRTPWCSCGRTSWPAITSAWSASRRS